MICPIGIGGIRSKLPAAIAVGLVAQIIVLDEALARHKLGAEPQQQLAAG